MSGFTSFPSVQYMKVIETGETCHGGGLQVAYVQQLAQIRLTMYKRGTHTGAERFRLKLYRDAALTKPYTNGVSDWVGLDDIDTMSTNWIGRVAFTFSNFPWLNTTDRYYVAFETTSYTRTADTFYVAPVFDWPLSVNTNSDLPYYGWAMEVFGYRRVGL